MPTFNEHIGVKVVAEAINILKSLGITVWIQDGTLLGAVREGKIIDWDFDLDVGVYSWEWNDNAENALLHAGFTLKDKFNTIEDRLHVKWKKEDVQFDIFLYYKHEDGVKIYHGVTADHFLAEGNKYIFTYGKMFSLKDIDLLGFSLPAPYPPEDFLIQKYGVDWKIPCSDWNPFTSPKNSSIIR